MLIGVDIGGTAVKLGVLNDHLEIVDRVKINSADATSDRDLVDAIIAECYALMNRYPIERIGVGSPGYVDMNSGVIKLAVNLPFRDTPVGEWMSLGTGLPLTVGNDATCAAVGELYAGLGAQVNNMVFVTIGTGIGGGIVIDRKVYLGTHGDAGEIGHICVEIDGRECGCGRRGCWEQYASVNALRRLTEQAAAEYPDSIMGEMVARRGAGGRTVFEASRAGCTVGQNSLNRYIRYLTTGLQDLITIFRPDVIALGGGLSGEGEGLLAPLRLALGEGDTKVEISKLRNDAGIVGAALMYRQMDER